MIAVAGLLFSCDYILKPKDKDSTAKTPQVVTGTDTDKDDKGCVISAGYRWSQLKEDCIRPIEEGYRLNSIEQVEGESTYKSAFVTFDEDKEKAELFLPNVRTSAILKKDKNGVYSDGKWVLSVNEKYSLHKNGALLFQGAAVQEGQVTGDDKAED
ncbi:hypothetical protein SAMN05444144_10456 [Flavobacterium akiainvivens]|nr:hypothetical protein SAMN05444144_10456 [Flavobacterium akiainvivens]